MLISVSRWLSSRGYKRDNEMKGFWHRYYDNMQALDNFMERWQFKYVGMIVIGLVLAIPILLFTAWQCIGHKEQPMTKMLEMDNESIKDTVVVMAITIAKQMGERSLSAFELAQETDSPKFLVSMSNYDCPVCGQPTIQPFSKKWLLFTLKRLCFYKCTNQSCPASKVAVYPEDISKTLEAMEDSDSLG